MKSLKENVGRLVRFETLSGPEWVQGGVTVTPVARSVRVGGERGLYVRALAVGRALVGRGAHVSPPHR